VEIVSIVELTDNIGDYFEIEYNNPSDVNKIKPWQSVWGSTGALTGAGRPHPRVNSTNIVMAHDAANSKIKITDTEDNSEMVAGATVYFYKGDLGAYENKNPWYFTPLDSLVTIPIALQMTFALSPWTGVYYTDDGFEVTNNTTPITGQSGYGQFSQPSASEQTGSLPGVPGVANISDPLIDFDII
jgi:hypothetical protein